MYKPPERIKHAVRAGPWPDRETARSALWFSPLQLGPLRVRDRTWVPAMVPWRASEEGHVTDRVVQWYARLARGRPGTLVVEATGIRDVPSGPLLRIGDDRYLPGLRRLVDAVRDASGGRTRLLIQLIDFLTIRRRPTRERFLGRHLVIGAHHRQRLGLDLADDEAVRERLLQLDDEALAAVLTARELEALHMGYRERVTDLHLPAIRALPEVLPGLFAAAARRARQAGFDGVELHYAHAYTMASLLSALNTRDDGYGGPREQRIRLPLDVLAAVRDAVGAEFCVGARMLADECIEGGSGVEDAAYFAARLASAGIDFLSFSRGGKFEDARQPRPGQAAYPYTGRSGFECMPTAIADAFGPFGRNVEPTAAIRARLRAAGLDTPVVVSGGIHDFARAEAILRAGQADAVGAARQSLADPDWFEKMRLGLGGQVRLCRYTNYCEGLDQKHKVVTCQLWDREALDAPDVSLSDDGRRRLTAPGWRAPDDTDNGRQAGSMASPTRNTDA